MINVYREGKELCDAAIKGAREGIGLAQSVEVHAGTSLRRSAWLLAGAAAAGAAAAGMGPRRGASRALAGAAVVLTGLAAWSSLNVIGTVLHPAGKAISSTRDSQWLRQHPITYA